MEFRLLGVLPTHYGEHCIYSLVNTDLTTDVVKEQDSHRRLSITGSFSPTPAHPT